MTGIPIIVKEIDCKEYEKWINGHSRLMKGGAVGKADKCPIDAKEAHKIIHGSQDHSEKSPSSISKSLGKGYRFTLGQKGKTI